METILIVEDEASVRATLVDWLKWGVPDAQVLTAPDAAAALQIANRQPIDLAVLDWNLGAGLNGLQLLEDLHEFHQATPLDALRLGVRDYLDKSRDLSRDRFIASIRNQLQRIRPIKRERLIHTRLERFRAVVAEALPKLETAAALQDEGIVSDEALASLLRLAQSLTSASSGVIIIRRPARQTDATQAQAELTWAIGPDGKRLEWTSIPFSHSLAAAAAGMAPDALLAPIASAQSAGNLQLSAYESSKEHLLGLALHSTPALSVVIELFDKREQARIVPFSGNDKAAVMAVQPVASLLIRLALGERASQKMLHETLRAALEESDHFLGTLSAARHAGPAAQKVILDHLPSAGAISADRIDQWADILQRLSTRYGAAAMDRIVNWLKELEQLLAETSGIPENGPAAR
jgi:two-component system nitrogen regulation response regulator NtrX